MSLTDEQIKAAVLQVTNDMLDHIYENGTGSEFVIRCMVKAGRAIESAATAPLLERITELEQKNQQQLDLIGTYAQEIKTEQRLSFRSQVAELERDMAAMTAKLTVERGHSAQLADLLGASALREEMLNRELEALRKDAGWRPIETAPKGLMVLYFPAHGSLRGTSMPALQPMIRVGHATETPNRKPTHWMPLPPPPDAAKEHP